MPSPWAAIDGLMRDLRTLRDDARAFDPALAVVTGVERLIDRAAQAVDETFSCPESEVLLSRAMRAIVETRERIQAVRVVPTRPAEIIAVERRRESPYRPYKQIATERKRA